MNIHFWGVRGSLPTPITPSQVQEKIAAALSRISEKDIEDEDAKMRFLANLPPWIYGTVGGNSSCVELNMDNGALFILDAGSGLRVYAKNGKKPKDNHYNLMMSHFHWDHVQGFPFFDASFNPKATIDIYSTFPAAERIMREQSRLPYFPRNGCWDKLGSTITFHQVPVDEPFYVDGIKICTHKMHHPGNSYSFSFEENGKKFIYATDVELQPSDYDRNIKKNYFFENADMVILDTQYTLEEARQKLNWGHSTFSYAVDFAHVWGIKSLYMFHHEPTYDDKTIYMLLDAAKKYALTKPNCQVQVYVATEDMDVVL